MNGSPSSSCWSEQRQNDFLPQVADNAVVFRDGGMRDYLSYVRGGDSYESRTEEVALEWRDDVADGLEVSVYRGGSGGGNGGGNGAGGAR